MKKFITFLLCLCLAGTNAIGVSAQTELPNDDSYTLVSFTPDETVTIDTYSQYRFALKAFEEEQYSYDNLGIVHQGKVIKAEHALISVHQVDACDVNTNFTNYYSGQSNYLNGCYGFDGAYIDTTEDARSAVFMMAGVKGVISLDDIEIIPVEMLETRYSTYIVKDGHLYHQLKTDFDTDYYAAMINLGVAPDYLEEDGVYLSYDGHYFYDENELEVMLDDYRAEQSYSAINSYDPYYNYYQFVSHRSLTNISREYLRSYFTDGMQMDGSIVTYKDNDKDSVADVLNQSQFFDHFGSFYEYQYEYGANAIMMLSLATLESATGRSSLAFTRNNLFGHAAYDNDVEKNASRYLSVDSSVYSHARYYISGSYCNPVKMQFHGGYFGNKSSGMNVSYASDPYWGEKAASNYRQYDETFGSPDLNAYTLGIKTHTESMNVYAEPNEEHILYRVTEDPGHSFIIIGEEYNEEGNWYKIQCDATFDEQYNPEIAYYYDFERHVAYIHQEDIGVYLTGKNEDTQFVTVTFDAAEGFFRNGEQQLSYRIPAGNTPIAAEPTATSLEFTGWDITPEPVYENVTYKAVYTPVTSIEVTGTPIYQYEINDRIDLTGASLKVTYEDGTNKTIQISTSMISGFDLTVPGDQEVTVSYAGIETAYPINVSEELDMERQENKQTILSWIIDYTPDTLTEENKADLLLFKSQLDRTVYPYLTQTQLREFDALMKIATGDRIGYQLVDNAYGLSVSGLSASVVYDQNKQNSILKDVIQIQISRRANSEAKEKLMRYVEGEGYSLADTFKITGKYNLNDLELHGPLIISIEKPVGFDVNEVFTVIQEKDGNLYKMYTRQTDNYIQFMIEDFGNFALVYKNTTNEYAQEDVTENITKADNSTSYIVQLGIVIVVAALIIAAIVALIIWWRKRPKKPQDPEVIPEEGNTEETAEHAEESDHTVESDPEEEEEHLIESDPEETVLEEETDDQVDECTEENSDEVTEEPSEDEAEEEPAESEQVTEEQPAEEQETETVEIEAVEKTEPVEEEPVKEVKQDKNHTLSERMQEGNDAISDVLNEVDRYLDRNDVLRDQLTSTIELVLSDIEKADKNDPEED